MTATRTYSDARTNLKAVIDAAANGVVTPIRRDADFVAVVDGRRLQIALDRTIDTRPEVVAENDGWSIVLAGTPIAADGETLDAAVDELIAALREYADDWNERLHRAANHERHWALAQFVSLSSDDDLRAWVGGQFGL